MVCGTVVLRTEEYMRRQGQLDGKAKTAESALASIFRPMPLSAVRMRGRGDVMVMWIGARYQQRKRLSHGYVCESDSCRWTA